MAKYYNDSSGVPIASPFIVKSQFPIDPRYVADTKDGLDEIIQNGASYEGLTVYVVDEKKEYIFTSTTTYKEKIINIDILNEDETLAISNIDSSLIINTSVIKRYNTLHEFPNRGVDNALYIDTTSKKIYMYFDGIYTLLNDYSDSWKEIELITGGDATNGNQNN